ncbi:MAG TPA: alpha/beta fold hydrolase [Steroidobacteraceae bacterium]|nr:alpha/beta fold hydrolase [Steroidobacteraceae bacterium]
MSPVRRADDMAAEGALTPLILQGAGFVHFAYQRIRSDDDGLTLFIEGDGSPWTGGGRTVAADPTPHAPIALALAAATPGSVLYLGRPCYFGARTDRACEPRWWTSDRYSEAIVASLAAAANRFIAQHPVRRVILVGYSGGGTLAVLMAGRVPQVTAVVAVAANLDPQEWARRHHYLPLTGSLDPALQPPLPVALPQWYLVGDRDVNVPYAASSRYLDRLPREDIWHFAKFDHRCCWVEAWPETYGRIRTLLR